ncbi:hypothetical protein RO3G_07110 [Rhizopus delemar RA 99-880]|uniref:ISXO2-like transposase domain-containing protein n=1 Tax=Rhizopus delemar (strain RA 99-880 / ATCC MYA-4621 / FGSC 9543 / NRRL 43880) TaxID=246409 RepID=I1C1S5_RHIO9|nr:hypothetical protein RO3G_07110 [Rhizopus delemar RA 99-880]|eukprot:EIE82405.1 hypothetical protein RO3G_07110 [Rhizopus delemar RA 99-880]
MSFINISTANYTNPAGIHRQRPVTSPNSPIVIVDSDDEVEEMHLETEQTSDLDVAVISINNDDNEELLEIEAFEVDDEAHNSNLLPDNWTRGQNVPIMATRTFFLTFGTEEACMQFFINNGIYYGSNTVYRCNGDEGSVMYLEQTGSVPRWRCNGIIVNQETGEKCCNGRQVAVRNASFFSNRSLPAYDALSILYFWSLKVRRMTISTMVGCSPKAVRETLKDWYQVLQEDLQQNDCKIGGYDVDGNPIVVEIDESKFGKRKYHRGHRVEGVWVVGGVEKTPERKCFLVVVNNRNTETMDTIIRNYVANGSIVHTDCWRAYENMVNLGMNLVHRTVNHSVTFRDGDVHTNTIEGTWNGIKINVTPALRTKKMVPWLLIEFIWRRKHHNDIFGGIIDCLKNVSFDRAQRNPAWLTELAAE